MKWTAKTSYDNRADPLRQSMKRAVLLILGLCFLTSITSPGFSEKPLRLFFEKNIQPGDNATTQDHVVQQGEWLSKILAAKGYSAQDMQNMLPLIQSLNPQIADINALKPGQVLRLPEGPVADLPKPKPTVPANSYDKRAYVIKQGDTVVTMLQAHGVPTALIFGKYMNLFMELNPQVRNTNTLQVGQQVMLPVLKGQQPMQPPVTAPQATPQPEPSTPTPPQNGQPVSVSLGDGSASTPTAGTSSGTAGAAGAQPGNGTALPGTENIPTPPGNAKTNDVGLSYPLPPLTRPVPPVPSVAETLASLNSGNATKSESESQRKVTTGVPYIRTVLEKMRFRFVPGDEGMYPLRGGSWLHIKLQETPLVETPWGGKVILCPVPKSQEWIDNAAGLGMQVCSISPQWSLRDILEKLSYQFPDALRLWAADRSLVFSHSGLGLTLQSPCLAIIKEGGRKLIYLVWTRQSAEEPPLPQGVHEVLDGAGVKIIELDAYNELSRMPSRPRESIYVPVPSHLDLIRAINPAKPDELFGPTLPKDLDSLLYLLKGKNMLQQGMIQGTWNSGMQQRIAIQVPAVTIYPSASKVALLDKTYADEYVVSILAQQGYNCFSLPY